MSGLDCPHLNDSSSDFANPPIRCPILVAPLSYLAVPTIRHARPSTPARTSDCPLVLCPNLLDTASLLPHEMQRVNVELTCERSESGFHPHCHILVTDGCIHGENEFRRAPSFDWDKLVTTVSTVMSPVGNGKRAYFFPEKLPIFWQVVAYEEKNREVSPGFPKNR